MFSPPSGDRDVINQADRLSSKETKIARRSVWIAVGASARSATTCMVVSRVGGVSNLTLSERRSLSRRPWDLHPDDIVVMDNLPAHKIAAVRAAIAAAGAQLIL